MKLIDQAHFVVAFPPKDIATAIDNSTYVLGDYVRMRYYDHLTIVLLGGASAGAAGAVTVKQATDATGAGEKNVTIAHRYLQTGTSTASDTWVETDVTASTWTHPATANLANIIEIDSTALDIEGGFEYVAVKIAAAGGTTLMSGLYILTGPRYISTADKPTAIA